MAEAEKAYMQSPLVLWVETFKANDGHPLEYRDLYDGVFLNDVMQQIDPRPAYDSVNRHVEDISVRLHNWDILVKNVRGYYRDVLQQLLVMRLPNITVICRDPLKESSFAEIRRALLLVLGCAVQCERKEDFIDKIMAMDITAQTEIVENIKEVTDDCETVLSTQRPESPTSSNAYLDKLFHHLSRLLRERDQCAELACDLGQERDFYMSQAEGKPVIEAPQLSPDKHHLALELAESKAKLRHIRQELEDRQEQLSDVKDELQENMATITQLKQENASLLQEARATRSLRDELDILKEKVTKVDMYEKEILKYKERLNELEFYKARTEELKEDNSILEETKAMLEDQLEGSRKRIETVVELESEMRRYRQQLEELTKERAGEREKLEYLTEENARLEFEKKSSMNESASLESELSAVRSRIGNMGSSLSGQLSETSHARVLRLELENQRLSAQLAEMKETALIHNAEISLELEKENQRLNKKIEKLQASACESSEQAVRAEGELSAAREEKARLAQALDQVKDNTERQVASLEKQNEQLSQALDNIRDRCEKSSDARVKDLERENKRLHEAVTAKNTELNRLEFESRHFQRSAHTLEDNRLRLQELEVENQGLEKENSELLQKVTTLQHVADRVESVEQESSDLSCENRKLQRTVESLQAAQARREQLEQEHISLQVDHQRLQRMIENLKVESERCVELETEKDKLNQQLQQLHKSLEGQNTHKLRQEQMEFELIDLGNEKQRLQKSLDVTMRRLHQLEKDNLDIETENDRLTKELDGLRVMVKRLEERDKEAGVLDGEVIKLHKDKAVLEKENRKLKQSSELKESALEELTAKFQALDKESKSLRRSVDKMKETCDRVKELERDNSELLQELNTDRRTLATLREDLVNEKIRSQELSNELQQLNTQLERVGLNTQKLTMEEQRNDANRYKALETMMEDTLKKSSEIKDEKIAALEGRLEQSRNRNLKLQEQLRQATREREGLRQQMEEVEQGEKQQAPAGQDGVDGVGRFKRTGSTNATKEIFQLKDHLVELERSNAKLLTDTENLKTNNGNLTDQCRRLETHLSNLQAQNNSMHSQYTSLKEQEAKLQVEHSTLQSQLSSQVQQQEELKARLSHVEIERERLHSSQESLQTRHTALVSDHEQLQRLHEQLTSEYEHLSAEHGSLKAAHKALKLDAKESQEELNSVLAVKEDVNRLRTVLEQEQERLQRELASLGPLQGEHSRLQDDHGQLRAAYDKLSLDYSQVLTSHKQVKTDYNSLQLKATELQGQLNEAKENMTVVDVEFQKLENKIETVYQINERIENENQALLLQIKQLLNQNHDLLTQALNSKDHFAEEEKAYLEKLSDLRRQKERLEEKIMEHYKNRMSPKKKGLGALIARKARGIISRGPRRSKSRNNLAEGLDNSSQGSGSTEHINDGQRRLDDVSSLRSLQLIIGAKSTENVNELSSGEPLLPGVGRPYLLDGEENQGGRRSTTPGLGKRTPGRSSPGSEMLTLDQFLKEANKSPRNENESWRRASNDSESKASDNSNNSNRRSSGFNSHNSHTDLASVSVSSRYNGGLQISPAPSHSRLSAGSGGGGAGGGTNDNSSIGSSGGERGDRGNFASGENMFTSTPVTSVSDLHQHQTSLLSSPLLPSSQQQHSSHSTPTGFEAGNINISSQSGGNGAGNLSANSRYLSHKRLSGGDDSSRRSSSQESSPYASTSRMNVPPYAGPVSSSSPRDPSSAVPASSSALSMSGSHPLPSFHSSSLHNSHSSHYQNQQNSQVQAGNLNMNNNNSNHGRERDLPPLPRDPPPPLPAAERLDRLMMLASSPSSPTSSTQSNPPHWARSSSNSSSGGKEEAVVMRRKVGDSDLGRRTSSQGFVDNRHQANNSSSVHQQQQHHTPSSLLPDQFQPPVPRSQPLSKQPYQQQQHQQEDNSVVSGHNPNRPASAIMFHSQNNSNHHSPRLQQQQQQAMSRARPASAMGPNSAHIRGVISRPPGEGRLRHNNSQQGRPPVSSTIGAPVAKGPASAAGGTRQGSQPERPKSVPPHMFNPALRGEGRGEGQERGQAPIPPPRRVAPRGDESDLREREAPDGREPVRNDPKRSSSVSLLREPTRSASRGPSLSSDSQDGVGGGIQQHPQTSSPHVQQHQGPQHQHQQNFSNHNGDLSSRHPSNEPSNRQLSHHPQSDQRPPPPLSYQGPYHTSSPLSSTPSSSSALPFNSSSNVPRQSWPGQQQPFGGPGFRPDKLNTGSAPPPLRPHSSTGHPLSPPSSQPLDRSYTPGPQQRRDSSSHGAHQGRQAAVGEASHRLPPSGAAYQSQAQQQRGPADAPDSNRVNRTGSLNSSGGYLAPVRPGDRTYHPPQSHPVPNQRNLGNVPRPATNGPTSSSLYNRPSQSAAHHQHPNLTAPLPPPSQQQVSQVPPQIRTQGQQASRQVIGPAEQVDSGDSGSSASAESKGSALPSSNASAPARPEQTVEEKGQQVKQTSSIWYEYGCV